MPIVTLLTDFGTRDWYVAAMKGVILTRVADAVLVDISHEIPPGDVAEAAFALAAAAPCFPAGTIHVAVVDPGVGSRRRLLALGTGGPTGQIFLAPDNGLLSLVLAAIPPTERELHGIDRPDLYRPAVGATFHGRDRLAPVAAALAFATDRAVDEPRGSTVAPARDRRHQPLRVADLGPPVRDPLLLGGAAARREGDRLIGSIVHVDRFGNLITNIPSAWANDAVALVAEVAGQRAVRRVSHYAELARDEAGVLPGSLGTLELALAGASLAETWKVDRGAAVAIRCTAAASPLA